jgi:hypothetical protein
MIAGPWTARTICVAAHGFRLTRVVPDGVDVSVIEAGRA